MKGRADMQGCVGTWDLTYKHREKLPQLKNDILGLCGHVCLLKNQADDCWYVVILMGFGGGSPPISTLSKLTGISQEVLQQGVPT